VIVRSLLAAAAIAGAVLILRPAPARRVIQLPAGTVDLRSEMAVGANTEVRGAPSGTVLRVAVGAAIAVRGDGVLLRDFTVEGSHAAMELRCPLPPSDVPFYLFARSLHSNGVLADRVARLTIENVRFRSISGFAVLISRSREITLDRVAVEDSGSRDLNGRNNATGGILLEEGTTDFRVTHCRLRNIRGNGIWTHSLYTSPRNARGFIALNTFENIGRDAIQVGHATAVRVEENSGGGIGFPVENVDIEHRAIPVAIDTAGNVDRSSYAGNSFSDIDGKCIDLDGFHDGEVRGNTCVNRGGPERYRFGGDGIVMNNSNPDMQSRNIAIVGNTIDSPLFGGIFVIGTGHRIERNRLLNLNTAHCNENAARFGCYYGPGEPDMLSSGIYLGRGGERPDPARGNSIEGNEITGYKMKARCIGYAPGVLPGWNTVRENACRDR
jgi:hypothetical protein